MITIDMPPKDMMPTPFPISLNGIVEDMDATS